MRRYRISVTPSLVIAFIALLFSLAGTAMAAVIITSNSQVAQNTIAGHATTTGIHSNLISGTINGTDLSSGYKASIKVHCPSGLLASGDLCVEPNLRTFAPYATALTTCALAGRRLPTDGELALAFNTLGAPQNPQWVAGVFIYNNYLAAAVMANDSSRTPGYVFAYLTVAESYRCVVAPHN